MGTAAKDDGGMSKQESAQMQLCLLPQAEKTLEAASPATALQATPPHSDQKLRLPAPARATYAPLREAERGAALRRRLQREGAPVDDHHASGQALQVPAHHDDAVARQQLARLVCARARAQARHARCARCGDGLEEGVLGVLAATAAAAGAAAVLLCTPAKRGRGGCEKKER